MKRVLIVGATSAIAADVARIYAKQGAKLALIGRSSSKLTSLTHSLPARAVAFETHADFTHCQGNAALVKAAIEALGGLDVALVAHGYLGDQLRSEVDFSEAAQTIAVNFTSAVSFIIPLANFFEQQTNGHLAVISSVAGERGRPRNYTYGAAKGALTTYLQGVRSRLWPKVCVHTIKLGPVKTPMTEHHPKNASFIDCEQAAHAIVRAIDNGVTEAFIPGFWRPVMAVVKLLPEFVFQRLGFLSAR